MPVLTPFTRQKLREKSMIALTIVCLPCICVVGTCVLLSHFVYSCSMYELPSTRRRRQREYQEREKRRRKPWVLTSRIGEEEVLTIGNNFVSIPGLGSRIPSHDGKDDNESGDSSNLETRLGKVKRGKGTHWQEQSPLFNLPLELRRQIYEEAIAGYTLHIFTLDAYRRMSHTRCKTANLPTESLPCQCAFVSRQPGVADEWGNVSLLTMLMSCRRIYSEAIEILYSNNTFTFNSTAPLISHLLNIPPQRILVMRDVRWRYDLSWSILREFPDFSYGYTRILIGATEWNAAMPWLECRKEVGVVETAGCACFRCWPQQIESDTRSHDWLRYCWMMRTVEQTLGKGVGEPRIEERGLRTRFNLRRW